MLITSRFSALPVSADFVKLKLPVVTVWPSITMTLLWAILWAESINVGTPPLVRNVADEYLSPRWLLSRITWTSTPLCFAPTRARAIGELVKLYAWTRMVFLAAMIWSTTAVVHPPFGLKYGWRVPGLCWARSGNAVQHNAKKKTFIIGSLSLLEVFCNRLCFI